MNTKPLKWSRKNFERLNYAANIQMVMCKNNHYNHSKQALYCSQCGEKLSKPSKSDEFFNLCSRLGIRTEDEDPQEIDVLLGAVSEIVQGDNFMEAMLDTGVELYNYYTPNESSIKEQNLWDCLKKLYDNGKSIEQLSDYIIDRSFEVVPVADFEKDLELLIERHYKSWASGLVDCLLKPKAKIKPSSK